MVKKVIIISGILFIIITIMAVYVYIDTSRPDPELNRELYYEIADNEEYLEYYRALFTKDGYSLDLKMGLDWFVIAYENIYVNQTKTFYSSAFDGLSTSTGELFILYNSDNETYNYLKPYLDCYLLMDETKKPSDEELENIKETILYALEYYVNGKDFVGTLD